MERNYYAFVTALPNISLEDHKFPFNMVQFKDMLKEALLSSDFELASWLFYSYDNINLFNILNKKEEIFDHRGIFTQKELKEEVAFPINLPQYMQLFLKAFSQANKEITEADRYHLLTHLFYDEALKSKNSFLRKWFEFEMNIKNIWTGLSCKQHNVSMDNQLIGSNEIVESIRTSHSKDFGISKVIPYADEVFNIYETTDLLQREKKIDILQWKWIEDQMIFNYFSIEVIIGFILKLKMTERWLKLEFQDGKNQLDNLLKTISNKV